MAVRAQRNQIVLWVYLVALANSFQGVNVVDVDEVLAQVSIGFFEIESAALTDGTMMPDTGFPGFITSFIGVDGNDLSGTFSILLWHAEFFRIGMADSIGIPDTPFLPEIAFFNAMFETNQKARANRTFPTFTRVLPFSMTYSHLMRNKLFAKYPFLLISS
ncbi:hypothetical protein NS31R_20170 [Enterobacter cancerogenus]|nr:hypothetical protein NS111_15380 [Enterobacter cancerogenus]KTQ73905.1 hypothetical protein NS188_10405 [Enterobacter cancerogenus]KTQ77176.1 hypothetical protein NS31R_20170 [Enterobacter cancerogenus]